jgi:hypothetical protein
MPVLLPLCLILTFNSKFFTFPPRQMRNWLYASCSGPVVVPTISPSLHLPQLRIAIPAREVFAVEERLEAVLRGGGRKGRAARERRSRFMVGGR